MRYHAKIRGWASRHLIHQRWMRSEDGLPATGRKYLRSASSSVVSPASFICPLGPHRTNGRAFSSGIPGDVNDLTTKIDDIDSSKLVGAEKLNESSQTLKSSSEKPAKTSESPILRQAATQGKTAMKILHSSTTVSSKSQEQDEERRRHSLKQATESLLSGTKATVELAETIAEIYQKKHSSTSKSEHSNDPAAVCLSELHKTFLNLTQDLLKSVDQDRSASAKVSRLPSNDQLIDLLLKLSYRAHQLSLSFSWPLYQQLAITLARQPHLSTMRSRAEWIWCIHQWSQNTWCSVSDTSCTSQVLSWTEPVDTKWFRGPLLELARHQHWSDLSYLLRNLLEPPLPLATLNDRFTSKKRGRRRKTNKYTTIALVEQTKDSEDTQMPFLSEDLVRDLLLLLENDGVLASLWKNLRNPSVLEEDVLEILLLMEYSIWSIFKEHPDVLRQQGRLHEHTKNDEKPKASLRDAIDVLLQSSGIDDRFSTKESVSHDLELQERTNGNDMYSRDTATLLRDVQDIIDEAIDLEDSSEDPDQESIDAFALAAMLLENNLPRVSRDLEVRSRRSGDSLILEIPGTTLATSAISNMQGSCMALEDDAADIIYSRVATYRDDIPDIAEQIFQHNGNRTLKYREDFETEIYESLRHSHEDWSESDISDDSWKDKPR